VAKFVFLPPQLESFDELVTKLDGREDLVGLAPVELYDAFVLEYCRFGEFRNIRSVGATLAVLTRIAHDQIEMGGDPSEEEWVRTESIFGTDAVPATLGRVLLEAIARAVRRGDISGAHPWHWLEVAAADELAR
jgi:hypothetical protein